MAIDGVKAKTPDSYVSPLQAGIPFEFVSAHTIYPFSPTPFPLLESKTVTFYQKVTRPDGTFGENTYEITSFNNNLSYEGKDIGFTEKLTSGVYIVLYSFSSTEIVGKATAKYTFQVVENRLPLKKLTITDVINRLLDVAEPIRKGEKPRFRLNGMRTDGTIITEENKRDGETVGQAAQFETVYAPQFSFTLQTLRECLKDIGRVIHGEPRLQAKKDEEGWYFEVKYDLYGGVKQWMWANIRYQNMVTSHAAESFCTHLDSNAENIINTLNRDAGVLREPFMDAFKTVRTENMYARVTESAMTIETNYPIYSVDKLECRLTPENSNVTKSMTVDITAYVFEGAEYGRLSSYRDNYPSSRVYALRYRQGQKNIDGLNFKRQRVTEIEETFGDYAIVAILKEVTGLSKLTVKYPLLEFNVTYIPIYNTRIAQSKPYYKDNPRSAGLIFNQQSNLIENKYYGENLKGMVARLGNVEKTITYVFGRRRWIPKAGMKFDDDYYISAVASEILPTYIVCTIALSKDFNRLSQYIGISSVKRYSEISESQAAERNVLLREFIVIGDLEEADSDTYIGPSFMADVQQIFNRIVLVRPISQVIAWGESYQGNETPVVSLPVISSAFGNSISFSWRYEDNYSAGQTVVPATEGSVTGYFTNAYRYTDFYGRIYYYHFGLTRDAEQTQAGTTFPAVDKEEIGNTEYYFTTERSGLQPLTLRKDNREALQVSAQVDFVTNRKDLIIGSALAASCGLVSGSNVDLSPRLYVFSEKLDKFIDHVNGTYSIDLDTLPSAPITTSFVRPDNTFMLTVESFPANGKSWAIVTKQTYKDKKVEDEQGREQIQKEVYGGDVLLAQNMNVSFGEKFTPIYFTPKRKIYNDTVWVDNR